MITAAMPSNHTNGRRYNAGRAEGTEIEYIGNM